MVKETVPKPCQKATFHLGRVGEGWEDLAFKLQQLFPGAQLLCTVL